MFPSNYTPPESGSESSGKYTKIKENEPVKLRILSEAITGYNYWTNDNKCIRSELRFESTPNIRDGEKQKHFWAFKVWNYNTKQIEIWEITQSSIRDTLWSYWKDDEYGDLRGYPLKITRTGKALETKYQVIAGQIKPLDEEIAIESANTPVNLHALYSGENPFAKHEDQAPSKAAFDEDF
ncbi:MAG: hypothetical protein EBR90_02790 [Actinobacteria bacterium]|nr:hypothetical protein [Actinomycetota bacterium]